MIFAPATKELVEEWKQTYSVFASKLKPNKKDAESVVKFITERYNVERVLDEATKHIETKEESTIL